MKKSIPKHIVAAVNALLVRSSLNIKNLTAADLEKLPDPVKLAVKSLLPDGWLEDTHQPEPNSTRYLSVSLAEKYSSVSRWTLTRAAARGELKMIKLGPSKSSKVLFDREEIDLFMRLRRCR